LNKIISNVEQLYQLTVVKFKECLLEAEFCFFFLCSFDLDLCKSWSTDRSDCTYFN